MGFGARIGIRFPPAAVGVDALFGAVLELTLDGRNWLRS